MVIGFNVGACVVNVDTLTFRMADQDTVLLGGIVQNAHLSFTLADRTEPYQRFIQYLGLIFFVITPGFSCHLEE